MPTLTRKEKGESGAAAVGGAEASGRSASATGSDTHDVSKQGGGASAAVEAEPIANAAADASHASKPAAAASKNPCAPAGDKPAAASKNKSGPSGNNPAAASRHDWDHYHSMLQTYNVLHGNVNVPVGHILYSWLQFQKANAKLLSQKQRVLLFELGVSFKTTHPPAVGYPGAVTAQHAAKPKSVKPSKVWTPQRYLDRSFNPPRWRVTAPGQGIPEGASVLPRGYFDPTAGTDMGAVEMDEAPRERPHPGYGRNARPVREAWEANILEREARKPWWKGLRPPKPEPTPPTRRSARLSNKASPAKEEELEEAECIPEVSPAALAREERAKRRQARYGGVAEESPPRKKRALGNSKMEFHWSKDELIDRFLKVRTSAVARQSGDGNEENSSGGALTPSKALDLPKVAPKKASYSEKDVEAAAVSNTKMLNQPCTIHDGKMSSGFITLTLPPFPTRLGIAIDFNPMFNFAELKEVQSNSPIAMQIPVEFRKDCFITSIESPRLGCVVPESQGHCVELLNKARGEGTLIQKEARVIINFAKNPVVMYIPKEDPLRTGKPAPAPRPRGRPTVMRKRCSGPCRMEKTNDGYTTTQWMKPADERLCMDCATIKTELGRKHFATFMERDPKPGKKKPPPKPSKRKQLFSLIERESFVDTKKAGKEQTAKETLERLAAAKK
ncbi:hypothetical protein ACHAXT_012994 [Thalassiosira profunda]